MISLTRRELLGRAGLGVGAMALSSLLARDGRAAGRGPHHRPRAKNVIFLFMAGAPSQLDLFEPKPTLQRLDGQPCPARLLEGQRFAFIKGVPRLLASPHAFQRHGGCGAPVSALLPHTARVVDRLTFVRSLRTTQFNHGPAQIFMNTGHQIPGRPSMGAWLLYGLGSEAQDLPGFVVMLSGTSQPDGGKSCWGSGFLPTVHQGVELRRQGDPVLFLSDPPGMDRPVRRVTLDLIRDLNAELHARTGDPEIATRIAQYELAFRMQTSVPELTDLSGEPAHVHALYGTTPGKASFANNCLLARRLVERGVRFVQLYHRGWDTHGSNGREDIVNELGRLCREVDQASAALVVDLERRGLLDETIVVWGGEFGRTPMNEGRGGSKFLGRDHHPRAFTMWLAGGGFRPGLSYGQTDELGYDVVQDPIDVHDLHATMLHLLGIDHTRLTYPFQGRDYRLTDVHGRVVRPLLA